MKSQQEKVGYILGRQVAGDIARQGLDIDSGSFLSGVKSAFDGEQSLLSDADTHAVMDSFKQQMQEQQAESARVDGAKNIENGKKYLADNSSKSGVVTTASGLQYKILVEGSGSKPEAHSQVVTHYEGKLIDGTVFDSSYARGEPASFPVNGVIRGWQEALQLMPVGSKWELCIPADLAYGEAGSPPVIGPHAVLVFAIELLEIRA